MRMNYDLWVQEIIRKVRGGGGLEYIERSGQKEEGEILIKVS